MSSHPANGVLRPLDRKRCGSTFQRASGLKSVTSAGEPTASVPPGRPNAFAGPAEKRAAKRSSESLPRETSRS